MSLLKETKLDSVLWQSYSNYHFNNTSFPLTMVTAYCLIFSSLFLSIEAARILAITSTPFFKHQAAFYPLIQELSMNHEVVFITTNPAFPDGKSPKNLKQIDVQNVSYSAWKKEFKRSEFGKENFIYKDVKAILEVTLKVFEEQLKSSEVKDLIKDGKQFDLILLEAWFRPALIWSYIYKVPVIKVSSHGMVFDNPENIGAPIHPIFYPDAFHQRIYNLSLWETISELYKRLYVEYIYDSNEEAENAMLRENFGGDVPSLRELKKNVHMLFLSVNPLWQRNRPVPLNVVYFGNVVQKTEKVLPNDIKSFLDKATTGAIYMNLGNNVPPSKLPSTFVQMILKVFSKMPYNILWEWNQEDMPGKPENLMISKSFPQSDVFRHPNMKLVITQGDLQTTEEAINNGLPLVGIPILGDQWLNVENYIYYKIGVQLNLESLTEDDFREAILEVLEDESYHRNVLRLRSIIHDQPTTPLKRAILWIEYTLRHGGTAHLRPAGANIPRHEYLEIELITIIFGIMVTFVVLIWCSVKMLVRFVNSLGNDDENENN